MGIYRKRRRKASKITLKSSRAKKTREFRLRIDANRKKRGKTKCHAFARLEKEKTRGIELRFGICGNQTGQPELCWQKRRRRMVRRKRRSICVE